LFTIKLLGRYCILNLAQRTFQLDFLVVVQCEDFFMAKIQLLGPIGSSSVKLDQWEWWSNARLCTQVHCQ